MFKFFNEKGAAHLLLIIAAIGALAFIITASTADFKDKLFGRLYKRPPSRAAVSEPITINPFGKDIFLYGTVQNPGYIKVPNSNSLNYPNGDNYYPTFTVEAWIRPKYPVTPYGQFNSYHIVNKKSVNDNSISGESNSSYGLQHTIALIQNNYTSEQFRFAVGSKVLNCKATTVSYSFGETAIEANTWKHIAGVVDNGRLYLYLNGKLVASNLSGVGGFCGNASDLEIGYGPTFSSERPNPNFQGEIDEVRISNVARYLQDFTPPSTPFSPDSDTIGLWHLNYNFADSSNFSNNGTSVGGVMFLDSSVPFTSQSSTPTPISTPTLTPAPVPSPTSKKVFVTKATFTGNLGGLLGADQKCQAAASNAGLTGTFKAWLSSSKVSASDRLTHATVPYKLLDGTVIANNWMDLVDGTLTKPINIDETGLTTKSLVWTNTTPDGSIASLDRGFSMSCLDWTKADIRSAKVGITTGVNATWTNYITRSYCSGNGRLYCVEQ